MTEYFKGILPDLQDSCIKFADTEIIASNSRQSVSTHSLILASLSPTLKSILLDHSTENGFEENVKILLPDIEFDALKHFFNYVIFNTDFDVIDKTLDGTIIELLGMTKSDITTVESRGNTNLLCSICNKEFSLPKLLKRHMKTYHHNVSIFLFIKTSFCSKMSSKN